MSATRRAGAGLAGSFLFLLVAAGLAGEARAIEYKGRAFRDPFSDASSTGSSVKDEIAAMALTLEGLVWNTAKPKAIVSGQIVGVGGKVGKAEVLDIKKEGVKMRYKGQDFYLRKRKVT